MHGVIGKWMLMTVLILKLLTYRRWQDFMGTTAEQERFADFGIIKPYVEPIVFTCSQKKNTYEENQWWEASQITYHSVRCPSVGRASPAFGREQSSSQCFFSVTSKPDTRLFNNQPCSKISESSSTTAIWNKYGVSEIGAVRPTCTSNRMRTVLINATQ